MGCINAYLPIVIIILDQIDTMLYGNYSIKTYTLQKNSSLLSEVSHAGIRFQPSTESEYLDILFAGNKSGSEQYRL